MTPVIRPVGTGPALAITVGLFYALCALIWALASGPFVGFAWVGFLVALLVLKRCARCTRTCGGRWATT